MKWSLSRYSNGVIPQKIQDEFGFTENSDFSDQFLFDIEKSIFSEGQPMSVRFHTDKLINRKSDSLISKQNRTEIFDFTISN